MTMAASTQEPTIHDDDDYAVARSCGIIADGMISTSWIMGLLLDTFRTSFLHRASCAPSRAPI